MRSTLGLAALVLLGHEVHRERRHVVRVELLGHRSQQLLREPRVQAQQAGDVVEFISRERGACRTSLHGLGDGRLRK